MRTEGLRLESNDRTPGEAERAPAPSPVDSANFVAAVVEAVRVRRRLSFFSWTQGHLQTLLPHGVLVCGLPRGSGTGMFFDYFHNIPMPSQSLARLCHPREGAAVAMLEVWRSHGGEPLVVQAGQARTAPVFQQLQELGMGASLAHGIPFEQSNVGAHGFFAFVSLRRDPGERDVQMASMLTPFVFSAYCRAMARDRAPAGMLLESAGDSALSEREVEILHWVREGKSNHEIGMVLSISPLTVKNHIQRILKKLKASNRTQAVSMAISQRLLGGAPVGPGTARPGVLAGAAAGESSS